MTITIAIKMLYGYGDGHFLKESQAQLTTITTTKPLYDQNTGHFAPSFVPSSPLQHRAGLKRRCAPTHRG
jgi:hypothetical protein